MRVAVLKADAAARRARDKAQLQKVWLVNVLDGVDVLVDRRGQRLQPRRPAAEFFDKRQKQISVRLIEPQRIDLQPFQGELRVGERHGVVALYRGQVPHPLE